MTDRQLHRQGLLLATAGALCWSLGGLLVRSAEGAGTWHIVLWRAAFFAATITAVLLWRYRGALVAPFLAIGPIGVVAAILLACANTFFIVALGYTTVANVLVLQATGPLFAALLARIFLHERVPMRLWLVIAACGSGMIYMFQDSLGGASLIGDALGLGIALVFAGNIVATRHRRSVDMFPAVALAAIISTVTAFAVIVTTQGTPTAVLIEGRYLAICAILGILQLGLGFLFFTTATRMISAAEATLLTLLETIAGPLLVWLVIDERPTDRALIGAVVVLGALAVNAALTLRGEPVQDAR